MATENKKTYTILHEIPEQVQSLRLTLHSPHFVVSLTQLAVVPIAECVHLPRVEQNGSVESTTVNLHNSEVIGEGHDPWFLCRGYGRLGLGSFIITRSLLFWLFNTGLSWEGEREQVMINC